MVDVLEPQAPLAIVHSSTFTPAASPVTALFASVGVAIVPLPAIIDHVPVPISGVFPANV